MLHGQPRKLSGLAFGFKPTRFKMWLVMKQDDDQGLSAISRIINCGSGCEFVPIKLPSRPRSAASLNQDDLMRQPALK